MIIIPQPFLLPLFNQILPRTLQPNHPCARDALILHSTHGIDAVNTANAKNVSCVPVPLWAQGKMPRGFVTNVVHVERKNVVRTSPWVLVDRYVLNSDNERGGSSTNFLSI